jgi:hypothetical protein
LLLLGSRAERHQAAGGPVAARTSRRTGQLFHIVKVCPLYPLYDKLRDPIPAVDDRHPVGIMVDQVDLISPR